MLATHMLSQVDGHALGPGARPRTDLTSLLDAVQLPEMELQGPTVLHESLEWQLSRLYWNRAGAEPFTHNAVPYVINNSGRLSVCAARLLFENLREQAAASARIEVLELGAGCGLFAKLFLDTFRSLCEEHLADYYDRLTYVVSDQSPSTLVHWVRSGMFEAHAAHVQLAQVDALQPDQLRLADGRRAQLGRVRAVFCNYVMDVLPATVWRRRGAEIEELLVTTRLSPRAPRLALSIANIREQLQAGTVTPELLALWPELDFQVSYAPARSIPGWDDAARAQLATLPDGARMAVSFGALDCLMGVAERLDPAGFLLVNDYGSVAGTETEHHATPQRFGRTVALGIHFPLLERALVARGYHVTAPDGDEQRGLHTRLITRSELPRTRSALMLQLARAAELHLEQPLQRAREHFIAGRHAAALEAYRDALGRSACDWQLVGEVAEFVGLTLRDYQTGAQLALQAIELNAWTSGWLWNVLGDCYFCLEQYAEAHAAFLEALRIDAADARTHYNLSQTHAYFGDTDAALGSVAQALARDHGLYRARLLQQQEQVLLAVASRREAEQSHLLQRLGRLGAA